MEELADFKDWCISENNVWGIPIPYFKYKSDPSKIFLNSETITHIKNLFLEHGSDIWWDWPVSDLLPVQHMKLASKLEKGDEVFDVWFDSSFAWSTLLSEDKNLKSLKETLSKEV